MARMPRMARTPCMARWLADYPDPYKMAEGLTSRLLVFGKFSPIFHNLKPIFHCQGH